MKLLSTLAALVAASALLCFAGRPLYDSYQANRTARAEVERLGKGGFQLVSLDDYRDGEYRAIFQDGGEQVDVYIKGGAVVRTIDGDALCRAKPSR